MEHCWDARLVLLPLRHVTQHSGSKWLKSAEIKFTFLLILEFFQSSLLCFHIVSVSGHTHFISKFCLTVEIISRISQFHDFLQSNSWRFLAIWPYCEAHHTPLIHRIYVVIVK